MSLLKSVTDVLAPTAVSPVGLDIGNFSVKLARVKKGTLGFSVVPIGNDNSPDKVAEAIKQACKEISLDSKKVNLSVSGAKVTMRYIILPFMRAEELSKALEFEFEKYIPHKKEQYITDYYRLADLANKRMIVLLVASERKFIEDKIAIVKAAGLETKSINVDSLALAEAFKISMPHYKNACAVLDIGYRISKLVIMDNELPYFSRDIETGEYSVAQAISEKTGVDFSHAKEMGYSPGSKLQELTEVSHPELRILLDELSLSFEYCERNLEKKVNQLFVCGGGSENKAIIETLKNMPSVRLDFWNPIRGFKVSSRLASEELEKYARLLAVAIGLAVE